MSDKSVTRLRPHHGLCLGFFEGYGYSDGFSGSMAAVLDSLKADSVVELTEGADCICQNCPNLDSGCPKAALYDSRVQNLCRLESKERLTWAEFQKRVREGVIESGRLAEVCRDCQWSEICAKKDYNG